jgi:aryl-alcohol dehydrogenase-like predicted oxidoreductase
MEVRDMLAAAVRAGMGLVDAGQASPIAEQMLGVAMPNPAPFNLLIRSVRGDRGPDLVEAEVRASLARLKVHKARAVVVQSASDLFAPAGAALWERLKALRDEGLFDQVGVSAYASDDPAGLARRFKPDLIQAPASLLDQRLLLDGSLMAVREMGIEVHLRSIFLNGLLFLPPDRVPAQLKGAAGRLSRARRMIAEGRSDPLQAALGFALSRPEADAVIVGASTAAELSAVIAAAASPPPDLDWDEMAIDDPVALDPRRWAAA